MRLQFLQRLALDAGNNAAHQPARLAHLDDHHQGRDRIKRAHASAEIIDLGHGATSIGSYGRSRCHDLRRPPHSFSPTGFTARYTESNLTAPASAPLSNSPPP